MDQPISVTVRRATEISGLGKTTIHKLFNEKKLTRVKVGRRTLVRVAELVKLIEPVEG
jgi:hypothetical protein